MRGDEIEQLIVPPEFYFQPTFEIHSAPTANAEIAAGLPATGLTPLPDLMISAPRKPFLEVAAGWNRSGLAVQFEIAGISGFAVHPQSHADYLEDSLSIFIDTRDLKSNRRASRFCHFFYLSPHDSRGQKIRIAQLPMPHSQQTIDPDVDEQLVIAETSGPHGLTLSCWFDRTVLTGFDPENIPSLGFYYDLQLIKRGDAFFGLGEQFPCDADPSLWPTLRLVD